METTTIITLSLGMVIGFVMILIALGTLSYFKVIRLSRSVNKDIENLNHAIEIEVTGLNTQIGDSHEGLHRDICRVEDELTLTTGNNYEELHSQIWKNHEELISMLDSRLDKLESKLINKITNK